MGMNIDKIHGSLQATYLTLNRANNITCSLNTVACKFDKYFYINSHICLLSRRRAVSFPLIYPPHVDKCSKN